MPKFWKDWLERVLLTALETFLAVLIAAGTGWIDVSTLKAAGLAAGAAGLSALKGLVASKISNEQSASVVPGV